MGAEPTAVTSNIQSRILSAEDISFFSFPAPLHDDFLHMKNLQIHSPRLESDGPAINFILRLRIYARFHYDYE